MISFWRVRTLLLTGVLLSCVSSAQTAARVCAQIPPRKASITIDASRVVRPINPLLYGQFIEYMFEGVKFGLHAELLRDRSFEDPPNAIGLPRYWERYPDDRVDDYALSFKWDDSTQYPVQRNDDVITAGQKIREHSLRVDASDGVIRRHGFYQSGIHVRVGTSYHGYLWLRTAGQSGTVSVALESDRNASEVYAFATLPTIIGDWRKYEFTLRPQQSDPLARFVVLISGAARVWIDKVSLLPGDVAPGGTRRDVFDLVKTLKPAFIRWPGGNVAQDYRWQWGVGQRDQRPSWTNLSWRNETEPSDFGTDEFVGFARAVGAEPSITVNVEGGGATVEEAAAWVEYCNGSAASKYGALRAANGHASPYNIKLWEIGNEIWGDWVRGHSDAETYARNFNRYADAMRAVDPNIKLIAVGDNDMQWNRTVLQRAGTKIDYLAIHHYYGRKEIENDLGNLMARPLHYERFYKDVSQLLSDLGLEWKVKLAINEWGLDLPEERQYSMESALYAARLMNVFERSSDVVSMSAVSDLVNGWPGGIIQSGRQGVFVSPIFLVNQLYAGHLGSEMLSSVVTSPTFDTRKEGKAIPYLDAVVSRSVSGSKIFIKAVNTDRTNISTVIRLLGTRVGRTAEILSVVSSSPDGANSFANPRAVSIKRSIVRAGPEFTVMFPPKAVSVITMDVSDGGR